MRHIVDRRNEVKRKGKKSDKRTENSIKRTRKFPLDHHHTSAI